MSDGKNLLPLFDEVASPLPPPPHPHPVHEQEGVYDSPTTTNDNLTCRTPGAPSKKNNGTGQNVSCLAHVPRFSTARRELFPDRDEDEDDDKKTVDNKCPPDAPMKGPKPSTTD